MGRRKNDHMAVETIRVGLVGAGFIGALHAAAWNQIPGVVVACVCDAKKLRAKSGARKFKAEEARWHVSVEEMLNDPEANVDVVDVCVPTPFHADMVAKAAAAGKHCVIEKPLARTVEQCDEIIKAVRQAGVKAFPAHVVRYAKPWRLLREAVKGGKVGDLKELRLFRVTNPPSWGRWFFDEEASGSIFLDLVIHDLDVAKWIVGEPVASVSAEGYRKGDSTHQTWDAGTARLKFASGVEATCFGSWMAPKYVDGGVVVEVARTNEVGECVSAEAVGTSGSVEFDGVDELALRPAGGEPVKLATGLKDYAMDVYRLELENFVEHVVHDEPLEVTLEDGREAVDLALRALASSKANEKAGG
ncbi:MAG: Gfo/Idh/MocA family oxidoreductase [Promethearchaeota archaeon]